MKYIRLNVVADEKFLCGIKELEKELPFVLATNGFLVEAQQSEKVGYHIEKNENAAVIYYNKPSDFYYAFAELVLRFDKMESKSGKCCLEEFGFMPDCSRNAVLTVETVKQVVRELAKMGYNYLMLYTEDNLEIESEPYYGYLRGRYSKEEIGEIICYAELFGIEVIPHIQALGHLETLLKNPIYHKIRDTERVLLAENEQTYAFLDNVIRELASTFKSKKIHIGMDEVFLLGAGQYRAQHGYKDERNIYLAHLIKVRDICAKYGFEKIYCYSECLYKMASGTNVQYPEDVSFDENFIKSIPSEITLVYWDYYSESVQRYENVIKKHYEMSDKVAYAAGAWKWISFAPANEHTEHKAVPAMKAVKNTKQKNMYVTAWGDDGGETSVFAILPSLLLFSEMAYGKEKKDTEYDEKCKQLWGYNGEEFYALDDADKVKQKSEFQGYYGASSKIAFYEDILLGIMYEYLPVNASVDFLAAYKKLSGLAKKKSAYAYLFDTLAKLCDFNMLKVKLGRMIYESYKQSDYEKVKECLNDFPILMRKEQAFYKAFSKQWHQENKGLGFEIQNIRFGGARRNLEYARRQLSLWSEKRIAKIDALEIDRLPFDPANKDLYNAFFHWEDIVSKNYFNHR